MYKIPNEGVVGTIEKHTQLKMKIGCNLKKLANFFKFLWCILEKLLKRKDYCFFFQGKITNVLIFSSLFYTPRGI